jgi:hypothetical protein
LLKIKNKKHAEICTSDDILTAPLLGSFMAKVFTITVPPKLGNKRRERTSDPRYVDGQRLLVEAMKYLAQADPVKNRTAIELISEHVRTRFRMSDSPLA